MLKEEVLGRTGRQGKGRKVTGMKSYVGLILMSLQCVAVGEEDPHKEWLKLRATWLAKRSEITASEDGARLVARAAKRLRNSAELTAM